MLNVRFGVVIGVLGSLLCTLATSALADDAADEAQALVDQAQVSFRNFMADPDKTGVREYVQQARGVLIVPTLVKAGFIVGGSGGSGVLLVKDRASGKWSPPAFYAMGTAGIGLQIGVRNVGNANASGG